MSFGEILRSRRKALQLTQQALADQLHVTRQTLSRWENNLSYPNLDTLVTLSNLLNITLDQLLKGDENSMVTSLSHDIRYKKRYQHILIVLVSFLTLILLWFILLGFGRYTQNIWIDRTNPFLTIQYGYAPLPNTSGNQYSHKIDTFVSDDPFGHGSWLQFTVGNREPKQNWALVAHKGSYVYNVRLVTHKQIPLQMREQAGKYFSYNAKAEPRVAKEMSWWPFN
ncbi:helix-turn-helix domain-containing protein [Lactobacillus sp. CC-MHH1034]|uniref:helix-turn-helix domain-containing protein n=1 Tax=Agrilactobacillus fermenti TaxID=2586909 RepID=UPI001E640E63|nr:helix-turn-helix domain-containing protein [Agrilactobacillus fermenti]MCD2255916.1 helix-turn-helix domain-containing protein [Agrilactobacillus fermenti]